MTAYTPVYRMTIYKPRSADSTESTALVPAGGAPHSDNFKVATKSGISGFQPYMNLPEGRRGKLDLLTRRMDQGQITVRVLDPRTTAGGSNLSRWATAFTGTAAGAPQLLGLKALIEESTDGGSTWANWFTGRISSASLDSALTFTLSLRDTSSELNYQCFVGRPHASATGVVEPLVLPLGLSASYGTLTGTTALSGAFGTSGVFRYITLSATSLDRVDNMATQALIQGRIRGNVNRYTAQPGLRVRFSAGGVSNKEAELDSIFIGSVSLFTETYRVATVYLRPVASTSDPFYTALDTGTIPDATSATFTVRSTIVTANTDDGRGLLLSDVHPVQLLQDLLDGYYGRLSAAGAVTRSFPHGSFASLIADKSFPLMRHIIKKPMALNDFVEKHILPVYNLGWYLDGSGAIQLLDLRPLQASPTSTTIADADLVARSLPQWSTDREQAITVFRVKTYTDYQVDLSVPLAGTTVPTGLFESAQNEVLLPDFGLTDLGEREHTIDAVGLRSCPDETLASGTVGALFQSRLQWVESQAKALTLAYKQMFGFGPQFLTLKCLRTSNTNGVLPGTWRLIDCDMVPGASSNLRGENRLMMCVESTDNGLTRTLRFVDAGPNTVATQPTVGTPSQETSNTQNGITVSVTLNGSSEAATLWIIPTTTSIGTRPADADAGWRVVTPVGQTSPLITASATVTVRSLPANGRIWVRVRTEPVAGKKLASAWAYPAGTGYVATATITAPSGLASSQVSTKAALLTWTNGDANKATTVRTVGNATQAGADAATPVDLVIVPAGTTKYYLSGLDSGGPWWHCDVYHRDDYGGTSSVNNLAAFQATGAATTAPAPGGIVVTRDGTTSPYPQSPIGLIPFGGTGVELQLVAAPTGIGLDIELSRAPDSGGSPGAYAVLATIPGTQITGRGYVYRDVLPYTTTVYWYKARHTGNWVAASAYTPDVSATAGWLPPILVNVEPAQPELGVTTSLYVPAGQFGPVNDTMTFTRDDGSASMTILRPGTIATATNFCSPIVLPVGSVITGWTLYGKRTGASDTCTMSLIRQPLTGGGGTSVATLTLGTGGYGNVSGSFTETVTTQSYMLVSQLKGNTATSDAELDGLLLQFRRNSYAQNI